MDSVPSLHALDAQAFLGVCANKFRWVDLSKDVVMDIGCGKDRHCCEFLVKMFPDVGHIIGVDKEPSVIEKVRSDNKTSKISYEYANIENRESLRPFVGRLSKVVSTHCFHQLDNKEEGFRNVHHMLKPGGEAGFLFCLHSGMYAWMSMLIANPKWKPFYQSSQQLLIDPYPKEIDCAYYTELMDKIGFHVVSCTKEARQFPYPSDLICKLSMYEIAKLSFTVPPELLEEFQEEVFRVFVALNGRDEEGRTCYTSTVLSLLVKKPEASTSKS